MASRPQSAVDPLATVREHPAARAWAAVDGGSVAVKSVQRLAGKSQRSGVFRLVMDSPQARSVIGKWRNREFRFECRVQEEILPSVGLPALEVYGEVVQSDGQAFWIFFEDAGDEDVRPSKENACLVARWLAALHSRSGWAQETQGLPDAGPRRYLDHLKSARQRIAENLVAPWFGESDRVALRDVSGQLDELEQRWDSVESLCGQAPKAVVHGDLACKNARLRERSNTRELLVFDWEKAGIGVPCVDLAQATVGSLSPDLECYRREARRSWPGASLECLERLAATGKVFRLLAALDWESHSLRHPECCLEDLRELDNLLLDAVQAAGLRG